jgi:uncharacterized linocin/CFP29 family protein
MNLLKRELAPVLPGAWERIEKEARRVLRLNLAGRRLVDVDGPHGWKHAAVNLGSLRLLDDQPAEEVHAGMRELQPLVEVRTPIRLDMMELDSIARGNDAPDLAPVVEAAERIAHVEDGAIFNGYGDAGIRGIVEATPHKPIDVPKKADAWPRVAVEAGEVLRAAGIDGPYALALGPRAYREVSRAAEDGYPIRRRVEQVVEGPLVWAPAVDGAVMLSRAGGDFQLTIGQDVSLGYADHDRDTVELYFAGSFTFRVLEPAAAVELKSAD